MVDQGTESLSGASPSGSGSTPLVEPASGLDASHSDPLRNETRFQRITREQAERAAARELRCAHERRGKHRRPARRASYTAEQRSADRIDGYDRDDLGLSPDF